MKKIKTVAMAVLLSIFFLATRSSNAKNYLSITHEVKNYNEWKAVYDKFDTQRKEAGIMELFIKKDINNSNSVTVFSEVTNLEKAQAFMSGTTIKEAMKEAGVTTPPVIVFYKSAMEYGAMNTNALVTTITHSVKDFAGWKKVYESAQELRKQDGIQDGLVLKSLSDENLITVVGFTTSAATFNKFISNPDLKTAMDKAGVVSKPEVKIYL